jgi:hypothetical protein
MALTDNLIAFWELEEASGTRNDSHGSNHLTDNNTVAQGTGKVGNCADFESSNSESLSRADNTDLSTGDIDFTVVAWVKQETQIAAQAIMAKRSSLTNREYSLEALADGTPRFVVFNSSGTQISVVQWGSILSVGSFQFVVAWHDATANTINIQVDNGTPVSAADGGTIADTTSIFRIGAVNDTPAVFFDGLIDQVGFWKRVLTSDELTELYNAGAGLSYAAMSGGGGTAVKDMIMCNGFIPFAR